MFLLNDTIGAFNEVRTIDLPVTSPTR